MPALALAGPTLADLWPEEAYGRESHPPLELERGEQNYLNDPDFDYQLLQRQGSALAALDRSLAAQLLTDRRRGYPHRVGAK